MKKIFLTLIIALSTYAAGAQTHLTPNKEECWLIAFTKDYMLRPAYVVVVKTDEIPNEKKIVERYLRHNDTEAIIRDLTKMGFRIETFYTKDLRPIPKKEPKI